MTLRTEPILTRGLTVSDKKIFYDVQYFSVLLPWQPEFLIGIKSFQGFLKKAIPGPFLQSFVKIRLAVSENSFEMKNITNMHNCPEDGKP